MSKILVIGASGQLGQCLHTVALRRKISNIIFSSKQEANILDTVLIKDLLAQLQPKYVINCAAYTAVDKAEDELELCKAINETGAINLAKACKEVGATLIHISTDFVYAGNEVKLLNEEDNTEPINVYGKSKLDGEQGIVSILDSTIILRTSWLYSEYGSNFVRTMLKLGAERDELNIVADQVGTPTYAIDLANAIFDIIKSKQQVFGIYNYSNEGVTSWYDFTKAIFEISGVETNVNPISSSAYPVAARRPAFSVMDKHKIKNTFNLTIPYWRDSLAVCISKLVPNKPTN